MSQEFNIVGNLLLKVDGAEAGLNKLKNSLSKLKMPEGLENSFKKSFSNLDTILARYKSQVEKGFDTKADVTAFAKTGKALDAELNRISKHFTELTGKEINFRVNSDEITQTEKELQKLIEQKEQLGKDSLKFNIEGAKDGYKDIESLLNKLKEVGEKTKTGEYASNALDFLKTGNIQGAVAQLDKAAVSCKRFGEEKQKAFQETGFDISTAIQLMIQQLTGATGKIGEVNDAISGTQDKLNNLHAEQVEKAGNYAEKLSNDFNKSNSAIRQADGAMQDFARSSQSMAEQVKQLQQSTQYFFGLRNMLNLFKRGIREAVDTVKELDKAMTETAVVTKYSVGDMWAKLPEYTTNANALGATVQDMYESTTLYYQQGLNTQQAMGIATETMKMARIAGLEAADATDMMTAALRGFNMEINETSAQHINDVYSNLAAKTASNTEELGKAMQRTASIAHSAGMSFEGTAAFLAQAIETTREPAENLGTAMKTIVARFQELKKNPLEMAEVDGEEVSYNKVDAALKTIGIDLKDTNGQFRDLDKVFLDISQRWDSLSQTQQRYIATTAAGSRQQSRFIAMMSDYERTMELMGYANDSAGASTIQFNKTLDSLEAKINKFQNAWKQFLMGIMNDSWTKKVVDAGTSVLNIVNKIIDTLSGGGRLKGVKSILSTLTAFTALKIAGRGANALIGGLGGMVDPKSNFKAGVQTGMIGKNSAAAINQPIVKELQSIRTLLAQKINQSNLGKQTITGPYDEYNKLKAVRTSVSELGSKGSTIGDLTKQLSGLSGSSQNLLMNANTGTFRAATNAIIDSYGQKNRKEVRKGERWLDNERKSARITAEEYYTALQDPGLLKDAMKKAGVQEKNPAYEYINGLDEAVTTRASELQKAAQDKVMKSLQYSAEHGYDITDEDYTRVQEALQSDKAKEYFRRKALEEQEEGGSSSKITFQNSKWGKALNNLGNIGAGISQAGMGIQAFGSILSSSANPALQMFGSALTTVGGLISGLGMGISGLAAGFTAISSSSTMEAVASGVVTVAKRIEATSSLTVAGAATALTGILFGLVAIVGIAVMAHKKYVEGIRKAAEEVTTNYKEKNETAQTNISNLQSWKEDFARLVGGVDANGYNVSLSAEDYDRYLEITRGIAEINPSIVEGYNAQGQAIITNNKALEETLALEKQHQADAFNEYMDPDSLNKLIKARDLSKKAKTEGDKETVSYYGGTVTTLSKKTGEFEFAPQATMRKNAKKVGEALQQGIREGWAEEDLLKDFNIDIAKLAEGDEATLKKFDELGPKIQQRINNSMDAAGDDISEGVKNKITNAFTGYSDAAEELDELVTPTYEYLLASTTDYATTIPSEFRKYFNQGLKEIASDANITDIDKASKDFANEFSALTEKGGDYYEILRDIELAQDDYATTLNADAYDEFIHGTDGAIERIENLKQSLIDNGMDMTQGYGKAISDFLDNEIAKIEDFTRAGAVNLQHALNTMVDQIAAAEGALENFNKIAEGTYYGKAASNISQIYESATADEHIAGEGDQVFWAGAQAIVGRKNLLENGTATKDSALKQMKAVQEMLKGGQEGWDNFKIRWFDSVEAMGGKLVDANGEIIQGIQYHDNGWIKSIDENLNPEVYEQIADALNMSKDSLIAMFNVGRQFGEIDFTNIADIRKALATSDNTIKNAENGKVFVKQDFLESEMTSAGVDLNKQQQIEEDLQKNYNTEFIQSVEEIAKDSSQLTRMGIKDMESLVKTFDETGQFTKDEIAAYAEAYEKSQGKEFDATEFNKIWEQNKTDEEYGGIPGSLDTIESILSAIESILANQRLSEGYLDNATAADAKKWLYGGEGEDTAAQKFWQGHGSGINGEITTSEFNKTSKDLNDFITKGTEYVSKLEEAKQAATENKDYEELGKITREQAAYEQMLERAKVYLNEGTEAYNNQIQTKLDAISQDKEVVNSGLQDLFNSITPESINTDAAQSTLNQLYEAAINNTPAVLTEGLMEQMQSLGIDIQKAIDAGLITDDNQVYEEFKQAGEEIKQEGVDGFTDGANSGVTKPQSSNPPTDTGTGGSTSTTNVVQFVAEGRDIVESAITNIDTIANEGATHTTEFTEEGAETVQNEIENVNNASSQGGAVKTNIDASNITTGISQVTSIINSATANIPVGVEDNATSVAQQIVSGIDALSATIDVKVRKTGISAITVDGHTWNITARAKGQNNHGYYAPPILGSLAKGNYGQLGPKGKGGLTLTGELGYEVAWLPSENRSMILGANGPQMVNLPGDAVIWNHEQSKKILKQNAIPAGSHYIESKGASDPRSGGGSSSSKKKKSSKSSSSSSSSSSSKETINNFSIEEVVRFNIDQKLSKITDEISKKTKEIEKTLSKIGTRYDDIVKNTKEQIAALQSVKNYNQQLLASYQRQLADYRSRQAKISYTDSSGNSQDTTISIASYLNADGSLNQAAIQGAGERALQEAIYKEVNSVSSLVDGINKVTKAIADADEQMEDLGQKVSEAFYQWENELTEVYDLTQRINNEVSFTDRFASQLELELSMLSAGFGDTADSIKNAQAVLTRNNDIIQKQIENQQLMIKARQTELDLMLSAEDERAQLKKYQDKTDWDSEETKKATLKWAQDKVTTAETALKYVTGLYRDIDGSVQYEIDWAGFNADNDQNPMNKESYEAIKQYLDDLNDKSTEFNNSIKDQTDFIKQTADSLKEYQNYIADFENTIISGVEQQIQNETENAKRISDSVTNALKDLLDGVKRKLDERRKQEDNAKTERDITQKQQRLAALRANTSGGNQVEIAKLEKEIADAQQSYQRTLEDQLLDKLQQQADDAAAQRERQIELAEAGNSIAALNNKELVDMWLRDPIQYKDQIKAAWLEAQGYNDKGEAGQYILDNQFESNFANLVTAVEQSGFNNLEAPFTAIEGNTNTLVALLQKLVGKENNAVQDVTKRNTRTFRNGGNITSNMGGMTLVSSNPKRANSGITLGKDSYVQKNAEYDESGNIKSYGQVVDSNTGITYDFAYDKNTGKNIYLDTGEISGKNSLGGLNMSKSEDAIYVGQVFDVASQGSGQNQKYVVKSIAPIKGKNGYTVTYEYTSRGGGVYRWSDSFYGDQLAFDNNTLSGVSDYVNSRQLLDVLNPADNKWYLLYKTLGGMNADEKDATYAVAGTGDANRLSKYSVSLDDLEWISDETGNYFKFKKWIGVGKKFKSGGLNTSTGPAWLDGTPSKPELVLNSTDTKNFLALKDVLSKVMGSTSSISNSYGGDITYEININVDKIEKDYDVDRVVDKVKKEITKGAGYRNVTQVRNFR